MNKYTLKRSWILLLIVPPIITMVAESIVNLNTLANADELPFALILIDKLYPVWGAIIMGAFLGLFISFLPVKGLSYSQRLKRAIVLGIIILNLGFLTFYISLISIHGFKKVNITTVSNK